MTPVGLAFCIALAVVPGTFAVVTELVLCHTERLRRARYSTLPRFLDGDQQ